MDKSHVCSDFIASLSIELQTSLGLLYTAFIMKTFSVQQKENFSPVSISLLAHPYQPLFSCAYHAVLVRITEHSRKTENGK